MTAPVEVIEITDGTAEVPTVIEVIIGLQGPKGDPGSGSSIFFYPTNSAIGGHRLIILDNAGFAQYADSSIGSHSGRLLGVSTGAVAAGAQLGIQNASIIQEMSWNWTADLPVFVGANGVPTQANSETTGAAFSQIWGVALSSSRVLISIREPIVLL